MKKDYKGKIELIENIALDTYKMVISSDLRWANPAHFISILCGNKTMRRPFSISDFEKKEKESLTTILFKLKGEGTSYLKNLKKGDEIDFLAPLGNGFKIENKKSLLIGAGIGIAPMLFLKKELNEKNIENFLISGFKNENEIIKGSDKTVIGGSVMDNIEELIKEKNIELIYACGPKVVLKMVDELSTKLNTPSQLALEKVMACSIGVCRGCVIKLIRNNKIQNYSVCKDGPVFFGGEIIWE